MSTESSRPADGHRCRPDAGWAPADRPRARRRLPRRPRRRWRSPTSARAATRPSRRRPTCRTSVGCCRVASTSCEPSSGRRPGDERGSLVDQLAGILADGPPRRAARTGPPQHRRALAGCRAPSLGRAAGVRRRGLGRGQPHGRRARRVAHPSDELRVGGVAQPPSRARGHGRLHRRDRSPLPVRRGHGRRPAGRPLKSCGAEGWSSAHLVDAMTDAARATSLSQRSNATDSTRASTSDG